MNHAARSALRVVINADDLGADRRVNDAVFDLMSSGHVTSATLLAAGEAVEEAVATLRGFPQCSFGAHLALTELRPLTSQPALAPLLDENGRFRRMDARSIRPSAELRNAVLAEWTAQVEKLRSLGVDVSHLDSHQHVHTAPWLFSVVKRVQRSCGIRRIRISRNLYCRGEYYPPLKVRLQKALFNTALRWRYRSRTADYFTSFFSLGAIARQRNIACGTIEAMVHPGCPGLDDEIELLRGPWRELARNREVQLISYRDL